MNYAFTEQAFRKLICAIKDKIDNHKHIVDDVEDLSELTETEIEEICDFEEGMNEDDIIPKATESTLGCVVVGDGLGVDENGRVSNLGIQMKLLWTNTTPTSGFAPQTISLDLSDYDMVIICVQRAANDSLMANIILEVGTAGCVEHYFGVTGSNTIYVYQRQVGVEPTQIKFMANYKKLVTGTVSTDNTLNVPTRIYGIKGVQ